MNLLFLLLLLPIGPIDQEGLIHTPPVARSRVLPLTLSDNEEMLGQIGVNPSTPALIKLLEHPVADSEVEKKDHAVIAARVLAERNAKEAIPALENLLGDSFLFLRTEVAIALSHLDAGRGRVALKQILQDSSIEPTSDYLMKVAERLAELGDSSGYALVKTPLEQGARKINQGFIRRLTTFRKTGTEVLPDLFLALNMSLRAMESDDSDERRTGATAFRTVLWGFSGLEDQRAIMRLREISPKVNEDLRQEIERTIEQIRLSDVNNLIEVLRNDPDKWMRTGAAWKLGEKGEKRAISDLVEALKDDHLELRLEAALALVRLGDDRGRTWLQQFFQGPSPGESAAAIYVAGALAELGDSSGLTFITRILEKGSWPRRYDAINVLPAFRQAKTDPVPPLLQALDSANKAVQSEDAETRRLARGVIQLGLQYLKQVGDVRALMKVQELSQSQDAEVRAAAQKTLWMLRRQVEVR